MRTQRSEKPEAAKPRRERNDPDAANPSRYVPPQNVSTISLDALIEVVSAASPRQQSLPSFNSTPQASVWYAGDLSLLSRKSVSIVGTRSVSPEGAARSRRLATELAHAGIVVVSGLARGVDTEALTAAIATNGKVIAVIGTPLEKAYPAENRRLQEQIYSNHLLLSQFAPGQRVFLSNFPERNKLMAAISGASVIIEAGETSGTLHQAAECIRLGRWLFIAKSVLDNPQLQWPSKFRDYPNVRPLTATSDLLSIL